MKNTFFMAIVLTFVSGCEEDYYPPGIYASQVEYMLGGGGSGKLWLVSDLTINGVDQELSTCEDSIKILFVNDLGSIDVYDLRYLPGCAAYDTTYYGVLTASVSSNLFTDTLFFEDGGVVDYVIAEKIDPENAQWIKVDSVTSVYTLISNISNQ